MKKKNNTKFFLRLRLLSIWAAVISAIFLLWNIYTPGSAMSSAGYANWTVEDVIRASESGEIISGVIQCVPSRGSEWYKVYGQAKSTAMKVVQADGDGSTLAGSNVLINDVTDPTQNKDVIKFFAEGYMSPSRYDRLLGSSNVWKEKPISVLPGILINLIPFLIGIFIVYLILDRLSGASKKALGFGKSRAKPFSQDKKRVTFADVAGCDEAKEEVAEIVEFLKNPKKFLDIGGRIPKGCLMVGSPGTGKTLLAKAVAGEAKVPFFSMSGSDFVEMFVGVGASRVRDLFEQGRKNAPCILFIDEIDAVGRQRGAGLGGSNDEREQTLNSLLVEMDGFDGREGVIIIAATNRPDILDPALLRPGRFDRQIVIDLPDIHGREEILKVHAKKIKLGDDADLSEVARNTSGFSGADLENLLNESALLAARENKKTVSRDDLNEARDKIAFGRERKKLMDDSDKKITAYHEAGHAIVQVVVDDGNLPVHKVTIIPRGQALGSTMFIPKKDILNQTSENLRAQICCSMGGYVAEELIFSTVTNGASADIKSATKIARRMVCDWGMSKLGPVAYGDNQDHIFLGREISRTQNYSEKTAQNIDNEIFGIIDTEYKRAKSILSKKKDILEKLANALLEYETLDGVYVYDLVKNGDFTLEIVPPKKRNESNNSNDDTEGEGGKSRDMNDDDSNGSDDDVVKIVAPEPTKG